jgi:trehalose 6-phosphate phosphatase
MSLPTPRTPDGRAGLAALLAVPDQALVALDFDGTISAIVPEPADARPVGGALPALRRLAGRVAGLAVVTGRPAATVVRLGGLDAVPGIIVEGVYGAERWQDGRLELADPPPGLAAVAVELPSVVASAGPGVWIEDKRVSVVVHTRRAPDPDAALAALADPVRHLAERNGLELHPGRFVLEIRPPGYDKGRVLRQLVADVRPSAVLFAGDDLGDLPAFAAVAALRADGIAGVTVASASDEAAEVAEHADLVVDGPAGVVALLTEIADAVDARTSRRS